MVKEALTELDSRKGVSSIAIQGYIKQNYPTVDWVRTKHLVRRALRKGIEDGTLVRPASSNDAAGAKGKFRVRKDVTVQLQAQKTSLMCFFFPVLSLRQNRRSQSQKMRTWIPIRKKLPNQLKTAPKSPKKQQVWIKWLKSEVHACPTLV